MMTENEEFVLGLFNAAKEGKHQPQETIKNYATYRAAVITRDAIDSLITNFKAEKKKALDDYVKSLYNNIDEVGTLINYKALEMCEKFYQEESLNLSKSIEEYKDYVRCYSSWLKVLFGEEREVGE